MTASLTIITVTFNRAHLLQLALDSVINQTLKPVEHIIIDNNSVDNTPDVAEQYSSKAKYKVVYIRENDNGIYDALNKGIKMSRGDWIHFLHSDDHYRSVDSLNQALSQKIDFESIDLISSGIIQDDGKSQKTWMPLDNVDSPKPFDFPHTGIIFKRDFFRKFGLYSTRFKIVSDTIHACKTYSNANIHFSDTILLTMNHNGASVKFTNRLALEMTYLVIRFYRLSFRKKLTVIWSYYVKPMLKKWLKK